MKFIHFMHAGLTVLLVASRVEAQIAPMVINFQGRLTDNSPAQTPINATVDMQFEIWDCALCASPASRLWHEPVSGTVSVAVTAGVFSIRLGDNGSPLPATLFSSGSTRYLQLIMNGQTLGPRQSISSTGYAMAAAWAGDSSSLGGVAAGAWQRATSASCPAGATLTSISPAGGATCSAEADPKIGSLSSGSVPRWVGSQLASGVILDNGATVGVGVAPGAAAMTVGGSLALTGADSNLVFADGSVQSTAVTTAPIPAGALLYTDSTTPPGGYTATGSRKPLSSGKLVASYSQPLSSYNVTESSGKIFIIGLNTTSPCGAVNSRATLVYDIAGNSWFSAANPPYSSCGSAAVAYGGKIYQFGGYDSNAPFPSWNYSKAAYVFDPAADSWSPLPDMPTDLGDKPSAAAAGGKLYLYGASSGSYKFYSFDPASGSYSVLPVPFASHDDTLTSVGGELYLLFAAGKLQEFDPATGVWTIRAAGFNGSNSTPRCARLGGEINCAGTSYSPSLNTWFSRSEPFTFFGASAGDILESGRNGYGVLLYMSQTVMIIDYGRIFYEHVKQ